MGPFSTSVEKKVYSSRRTPQLKRGNHVRERYRHCNFLIAINPNGKERGRCQNKQKRIGSQCPKAFLSAVDVQHLLASDGAHSAARRAVNELHPVGRRIRLTIEKDVVEGVTDSHVRRIYDQTGI